MEKSGNYLLVFHELSSYAQYSSGIKETKTVSVV
jgi:hypothetical protein